MTEIPFTGLELAILLALGAGAGFLAGLIAIGGGFVLVPGLYLLFSARADLQPNALALTLGTTMACMLFSGTVSAVEQYKRGAVELDVVKRIGPWLVPATVVGTVLAGTIDGSFVRACFAAFCLYSAAGMAFFSATLARPGASVQGTPAAPAGLFIGTVCGMLAVGGANLFVPFMMKRNIDARTALATASALQLPIAVAGTAAYVLGGLSAHELPAGSLGYVYLPALLVLAPVSILFARLGVRATHALPVAVVKKMFAGFTALAGLKMTGVLPF
jgi:uncharacterized protein